MEKRYTETRTITVYDLQNLCIRRHWFTRADCEEYGEFLTNAADIENITTQDLANMAAVVERYSDTDGMDTASIMWELNEACNVIFREYEGRDER